MSETRTMDEATMAAAAARFERTWARAVRSAGRGEPLRAAEPPDDDTAGELAPRRAIDWLRGIADRCFEEGLLDAEAHARLRRCSDEQSTLFDAVDPERLLGIAAVPLRR